MQRIIKLALSRRYLFLGIVFIVLSTPFWLFFEWFVFWSISSSSCHIQSAPHHHLLPVSQCVHVWGVILLHFDVQSHPKVWIQDFSWVLWEDVERRSAWSQRSSIRDFLELYFQNPTKFVCDKKKKKENISLLLGTISTSWPWRRSQLL